MVISVFPDYGQAIDRYRSTRSERLERQAQDAQRAAYNRLLGQVQDPLVQQVFSGMDPERGQAALASYTLESRDASQRAEAERAEQARERQLGVVTGAAERFPVWQQQNPEADPMDYWTRQAGIAESMGVPVQRDESGAPASFANIGMSLAMGRATPNTDRTQLERTVSGLVERGRITQERADEILTSSAEVTAGLRPRPSSGGGADDIIRATLSAFPNLRDQEIASYDLERLRAADEQASTANSVLATVDRLDERMDVAGGSTQGALGFIRQVGTGLLDQLDQLSQFGEGGQMLAGQIRGVTREARSRVDPEGENGLTPETMNEFFNPELGGVAYLTGTLAYMIAKMRDPGGRVTDKDFESAVRGLGGGPFGGGGMLDSALTEVRFEAQEALRVSDRVRSEVRSGSTFTQNPPTQTTIDPNAPLDELIDGLLADQP